MAFNMMSALIIQIIPFFVLMGIQNVESFVSTRRHGKSEARGIEREDIVSVSRYLRNYMTGPVDDEFTIFTSDVVSAYVGPAPKGHPIDITRKENDPEPRINGTLRLWAMINKEGTEACELQGIHDWGETALFLCPQPGIYRAYAVDYPFNVTSDKSGVEDPVRSKFGNIPTLVWRTHKQTYFFNLLKNTYTEVDNFFTKWEAKRRDNQKNQPTIQEKDKATMGNSIFTWESKLKGIVKFAGRLTGSPLIVQSDPVEIKKSFYCYNWMYQIGEKARVGYVMDEVVPSTGTNGTSYILLDVLIWIAQPSSIHIEETSSEWNTLVVSEYSKMLTNRYYSIGLFPCLRKAHTAIEVVSEIIYVSEHDQNNQLNKAPHWKATLKIHTDRLISTLSDVTFTIASRQNAAFFSCFVGDTRVFISLRKFEFVPRKKLERSRINLRYTKTWDKNVRTVQHQMKHLYGHGVQYIGYAWSKKFQPGSSRSDMTIINNPCIASEFAFAAGGSLYVAHSFLENGLNDATKVVLPTFDAPDSKKNPPDKYRDYLRIHDVAFTPTHFAVLTAESSIYLHPSSISQKGVALMTNTQKHKLAAFVKRRWCTTTATPKLNSMMLPMFGTEGSVIILQVYPTEGSTRMWVKKLATTCLTEGIGFVKKREGDLHDLVNETDIHYNEFALVNRTDHITGLDEKRIELRPEPPAPPPVNFDEELNFLINQDVRIGEGMDPHYPPDLINPAAHGIEEDLTEYNEAVIYILDEEGKHLNNVLEHNGIESPSKESKIATVEFTIVEKKFIIATTFQAKGIPTSFSNDSKVPAYQMVVTTLTVTNFPLRVKAPKTKIRIDESLDTVMPFPGFILLRSKAHKVPVQKSRDPEEEKLHSEQNKGATTADYSPEIFTLSTAIPSYVIDYGDIFLYTSLEGRYARPLHFFKWEKAQEILQKSENRSTSDPPPVLKFDDGTVDFKKPGRLFDAVVTEDGFISILYRKAKRHLIQDDEDCLTTNDTIYDEEQSVVMGSVVLLYGLREVKPFFRNDNVFQRVTPDGEIIYGIYDVKPHSPWEECPDDDPDKTKSDVDACIEQPKRAIEINGTNGIKKIKFPVCVSGTASPCLDPAILKPCPSQDDKQGCIRYNNLTADPFCYGSAGIITHTDDFKYPGKELDPECFNNKWEVTNCLPKYSPREELRTASILGVPFLTYFLGSLGTLPVIHPEAPEVPKHSPPGQLPSLSDSEPEDELDVCPFSSFNVYNTDFDFAEVGYQTRITGEISYFGKGIPIEADLLVEYEPMMGVIIEISSAVEEERSLTTIRKTIDIKFTMTDFTLRDFLLVSEDTAGTHDYDERRAREKASVFGITFRPTIINLRCKHEDFFKTVQFNVGCNAFSTIRLLSEATPLKRVNWTEALETNNTDYRWYRDIQNMKLTIPNKHVHRKQYRQGNLKKYCNDTYCHIPFFKFFKNNIFTISYRDFFFPKFEQFLTVSSRRVSGNMIIYDLLGSQDFNVTLDQLKASCFNNGDFWYLKLLNSTQHFNTSDSTEHDNIYKYYIDCYEASDPKSREEPQQLQASPFYTFNLTNGNKIKFRRVRNQIFIFRAVIVNTPYNRFTYCKLLDTFFMVRVTGIPIPRQGLDWWFYLSVIFFVFVCFFSSYLFFFKFYTWKLDMGAETENNEITEQNQEEQKNEGGKDAAS